MLSKIVVIFIGGIGLYFYWDNLPQGYKFFLQLLSLFGVTFVSCGITWMIWMILTNDECGGD